MTAKFRLGGGIIPRTLKRLLDERSEKRVADSSGTAVLSFRGSRHVVPIVNTSSSGAMIIFPDGPPIGERVSLELSDRGQVTARVRWVRDGRIGVTFDAFQE